MEKTNKKILEEIIRVDHAGERGAIKIYEGQLLALKTIKQDNDLKDKIENINHYNSKKKDKTYRFASFVGLDGCHFGIWYCFAWKKSCYALYRFGRGSN